MAARSLSWRRPMSIALFVLLGGYAAIVLAMWLLQDHLVFPGARYGDRGLPRVASNARVEALTVELAGERFTTRCATLAPTSSPRAVLLYFGGNGEDLYNACYTIAELVRYRVEAVAIEHPGFGRSGGRPSVSSLLANALAARAFGLARAQQLGVPLIVVGSSLGSFPAVHAAKAGGVAKLLLRAPPTNLVEVAARHYRWLPVAVLLRHRFDNLAPAPQVACPVLIVHGDRDRTVPPDCGQRLGELFPQGRCELVAGFDHDDLSLAPDGPVGALLREFLELR
jgi:uncharacterized protein